MNQYAIFLLIVFVALLDGAVAFCNVASPKSSNRIELLQKVGASAPFFLKKPSTRSSLVLHYDNNNYDSDLGSNRAGIPILIASLLVCAWFFTIPPEFRRARYCGSTYCADNRAECNNCKTVGELQHDIQDYYRHGGGIKWDFSIDPVTQAEFYANQ